MTSYKELNIHLLNSKAPLQWFRHARINQSSIRIGNLQGDKGSSLWICLKTGAWCDYATGEKGGDLISLYAAMHNIPQSEAKKELEGGCYYQPLHSKKSICPQKKESPKKLAYISELWDKGSSIKGTKVEFYLRTRAINLAEHYDLRYLPQLHHSPSGKKLPVMLAAVRSSISGKITGLHRTWLEADGSSKADIPSNRMMFGKVLGGAVQLAHASQKLIVAEGIETALSAMQSTRTPAWAALSTAGLKALILPSIVQGVIIACDNDKAGLNAANEAAKRWEKEGKKVFLAIPPVGLDFNDLLVGAAK